MVVTGPSSPAGLPSAAEKTRPPNAGSLEVSSFGDVLRLSISGSSVTLGMMSGGCLTELAVCSVMLTRSQKNKLS
jgi:hypothetical protein